MLGWMDFLPHFERKIMTYCVALNLKHGLIFASDTRTNAGVDHIASFKKMTCFKNEGERNIFILTSGNLATSQAVIERLQQDIHSQMEKTVLNVPTLFDVAELVGVLSCQIANQAAKVAQQDIVTFGSNFLVGGQIRGQMPKLYSVYSEGNCIAATEDTPFFQIGESKYGKPILDRVVTYETELEVALKAVLLSFDSSIRSNLSVGFPIDLMVYQIDSLRMPQGRRIHADDEYMLQICQEWGSGLVRLLMDFDQIPLDYTQ